VNGVDDRRGFVRRIQDARKAYKGPFTGAHVCEVVEDAGYKATNEANDDEFLIFVKEGQRAIPVNPSWESIWADDPIFKCISRDLGHSQRKLLMGLNRARGS
jgi:hypothetical protein